MQGLSDTTALILAGGLGTRLRSVVSDRPKVLADVGGRPFLSYLLDDLHDAGVRRVVLSIGYLGEMVQRAFGGNYREIEVSYAREDTPLGTGGAIRHALPLLEGDPVLAMNGDSWHRADLDALCATHERCEAAATLVVTRVEDASRYGRVALQGPRVSGFEEKGAATGPAWVNAGIYLLEQHLVESIPTGRPVSFEREVLPRYIGRGLCALRSEGGFIDIGTPEDYGRADGFITGELSA